MAILHPKGYVAVFTPTKPPFSGNLESAPWNLVQWTDDFVDIEGDKRPIPRHKTRVKMLWDSDYFYIAAVLEEPHIWATLTEHDSVIFQDNDFEVFIDPNGDNHQYFEFEINALGTYWDLRLVKPYRDGGPALNEWEIPGLISKVHVFGTLNNPNDIDKKWVVELAIPWKDLAEFAGTSCPPNPGDQWRINFSRVQWETNVLDGNYVKVPNKKEDNWVWSPQGAIDMHRPEMWGYVQFEQVPTQFRKDPDWDTKCELMDYYWKHKGEKFEKAIKGPSGKTWHIREDSRIWSTP